MVLYIFCIWYFSSSVSFSLWLSPSSCSPSPAVFERPCAFFLRRGRGLDAKERDPDDRPLPLRSPIPFTQNQRRRGRRLPLAPICTGLIGCARAARSRVLGRPIMADGHKKSESRDMVNANDRVGNHTLRGQPHSPQGLVIVEGGGQAWAFSRGGGG